MYRINCVLCQAALSDRRYRRECTRCGGPLNFVYSKPKAWSDHCKSIWRYRTVLPVREGVKVISLGEGQTPLQKSRLESSGTIYVKNETVNPTGSHKDRALAVGVTKAVEFGYKAVMLYSDGSAALSSAAYAARAGLRNLTVIPRGTIRERMLPLAFYSSHIIEYAGSSADALTWVQRVCREKGVYETSTYRRANPYQSEGPKTIGFEILEQLSRAPDWVVVPVGGGGTLAAVGKAFVELRKWGLSHRLPRLVGVVAQGYTTIERAMALGAASEEEFGSAARFRTPHTLQVKIAMCNPPDGLEAIQMIRESKGFVLSASDEEAVEAQKELASLEGIYAEPSGAAAWVGVKKLLVNDHFSKGDTIVAVVTGSGYRETRAVARRVNLVIHSVNSSTGARLVDKLLT